MARALRIKYPNAYYHLVCRGNERKEIFYSDENQRKFLDLLSRSIEIYNVNLYCFALMPNHFHLLVSTPEGNVSEFMRHFNISYTQYFNWSHNRSGHLYQGRYKSHLIEKDAYLLTVSRYIHLNCIRIKEMADKTFTEKWRHLQTYRWSSFRGYLNKKHRIGYINYKEILGYFGQDEAKARTSYRSFVKEGAKKVVENPFKKVRGQMILGTEQFVEWVKETFLKDEVPEREHPALKQLRKKYTPEEVIQIISKVTGKKRDKLFTKNSRLIERAMLMEILYRYSGLKQSEIGEIVGGIDYSAVSQIRKRLQQKLDADKKMHALFREIETRFKKEKSNVEI